jgi:hypothetical protein
MKLPLADLTADGIDDLVLPVLDESIVVALGSADRTFLPIAHPSLPLGANLEQLALRFADVFPERAGDEVVALGTIGGISALAAIRPGVTTSSILAVTDAGADALAGKIHAAQLDATSDCEEVAFGFLDRPSLLVYTPCITGPDGLTQFNEGGAFHEVSLAPGARLKKFLGIEDADRDGHLDLIAVAEADGSLDLAIAFGSESGAFTTDAARRAGAEADDRFGPFAALVETPFAVGHLDDDALLDWVDSRGIWVTSHFDVPAIDGVHVTAAIAEAPWTVAAVLDANHDGSLDVAVGNGVDARLSLFRATGLGTFAPVEIALAAPAVQLSTGDFDGDRAEDLAVVERRGETPEDQFDVLSVFYGDTSGVPSAAFPVGRLDQVLDLVVYDANNLGPVTGGFADGIRDIAAVARSRAGRLHVGGFFGSTDRELRSPYVVTEDTGSSTSVGVDVFTPIQLAHGDFDGDALPDVAELVRKEVDPGVVRLAVTPTDGLGQFTGEALVLSADLPHAMAWERALMAGVDLDGDDVREIVWVAPTLEDPGEGALGVARVVIGVDESRTLDVADPSPFDGAPPSSAPPALAPPPLSAVDLDGDGATDLVALLRDAEDAFVVVFWNDLDGTLGAPQRIHAGPGITGFTLLQMDSDPEQEVVLLEDAQVFVADRVAQEREFVAREGAILSAEGAFCVAGGDVDGNGVDDLFTAGSQAVTLWRGLEGPR